MSFNFTTCIVTQNCKGDNQSCCRDAGECTLLLSKQSTPNVVKHMLNVYQFVILLLCCTCISGGIHKQCVDRASLQHRNAQLKEELHQIGLRQLTSTCEDSVLSYGQEVSEAFGLNEHNCTTESGSFNSTNLVHCPGGTVCCNGKCYGSVFKQKIIPKFEAKWSPRE